MPEGDTIFRSARALHRALAGRAITRFEAGYARLARADDDYTIAGRTVEHVEARGKWLLIFLSDDLILLTHMLMNGSWHLYRPGERWRRQKRDMRLVIETAEWVAVGFTVPVAEFHTSASLIRKTGVMTLGPDLLKQEFDRDQAIAKIRERRKEEIAVVLLNQHVLAGIGNVFKSEICFVCRVHPFCRVETLTEAQIENIVDVSRRFLKANVSEENDTGARRTMSSLNRNVRLWVYGRRGEPCRRCGAAILMRKQGSEARTTFWCPNCQIMETSWDQARVAAPRVLDGASHGRRGTRFR
ncbi:MAG TPA: DNA-formamidopyrimidine glycosylase family protein [Acidobacteriaceae bacterium]|nr:DNA-formamidopyrimidine glycosylase family protein [Acidobacteriaceae bacterium]